MKVSETSLPGVLLLEPHVFEDSRGYFMETWNAERYHQTSISGPFLQANFSHSTRGVLRGLHYQLDRPQGKLVWVTRGDIFDVAVDIRKLSPTYRQWVGLVLSSINHFQVYIPPGFAHGYCVLSEECDMMYLCTDLYAPDHEFGIRWDDEDLKIDWPISTPLVSQKDNQYPMLKSIPSEHLPDWEPG